MLKDLDPILHSQLRLGILSVLMVYDEAEFNFLKQKTNTTPGNLSAQISKLKSEGYIEVEKRFPNNFPQTVCKITPKGIGAFNTYVERLQAYIKPKAE